MKNEYRHDVFSSSYIRLMSEVKERIRVDIKRNHAHHNILLHILTCAILLELASVK